MRLVLGDQDLVLGVGEAVEFDTQLPHWFGSTGDGPAEVLSIFGRPGNACSSVPTPEAATPRCTPTRTPVEQRVRWRVVAFEAASHPQRPTREDHLHPRANRPGAASPSASAGGRG